MHGHPDCADRSDEDKCPPSTSFQSSSPPHYSQQIQNPHVDFMQEISGVQICIFAVALVLTLGLITCVINHYNKMGAKSWNGDQRKNDHPRKSSSAAATLALYSPSKARERARREMLLCQEHQLRMLSVQTDIALNLPSTVQRPDIEENQLFNSKQTEVPRAYLIPPPNRTIAPNRFTRCPPQEVHQHSTRPLMDTTDCNLVNSYHRTTKKRNPSLFVRISNSLERWHPLKFQNKDVCTIAIFENAISGTDDLPPKYEDVVQDSVLPPEIRKNQRTCN